MSNFSLALFSTSEIRHPQPNEAGSKGGHRLNVFVFSGDLKTYAVNNSDGSESTQKTKYEIYRMMRIAAMR